jgi:hypothetical protein
LAGITQDKRANRYDRKKPTTNNNLECIHMGQASKALFY